MRPSDADVWREARRLFDEAVGLDPRERDVLLRERTRGQPELRNRVERLLEADTRDTSPLETVEPVIVDLLQPAALMAEMGQATVEPYRVTRSLGAGGMGAVYLAERADGAFDRTVALKLVHRGFDSAEVLRRFEAERRILAGLDHPHIARMYDAGVASDGRPFLVMEHVDGEPIQRYADRARLSRTGRIELVLQVCDAVAHAHEKLVIHRDLKPSNVLVDRSGQVKLLDFGIAKLVDDESATAETRTRTGHRLLTPEYASPEQLRGDVLTTRSDVYALGALLHELVLGRRPFPDAASAMAYAFNDTPAGFPPGLGSRSGLEGDLVPILQKALAHDPGERYEGAGALASDLRALMEGRPVKARPATWSYRLGRFVRRHRWSVSAGASAAVLLVAATAVAVVQADRARQERDTAVGVSTFLEQLFAAPDPRAGQLPDTMRVMDFLEGAVDEVRNGLTEQPSTRARLLYSLGSVTRNLSRSDLAVPLLRDAVAAHRSLYGAGHPDEIQARELLGLELSEGGAAEEGLAQLDTALTLHLGSGRADPAVALRLRERLGQGYATVQRNAEALPHLEAVVDAARLADPPDPVRLASALNTYGSVLAQAGRLPEAASALGESADQWAASERDLDSGSRALDEGVIRNNLSFVMLQLGRFDEAETQVRRARDLIRPRVPSTHGLIARTDVRLAEILAAQWREAPDPPLQAEADSLFRAGLALGLEIPEVRRSRPFVAASFAGALRGWGRLDEAETWIREAVAAAAEMFGAEHPVTLTTTSDLGRILALQGRYAEALETSRDALSRLDAIVPVDAPPRVNAATNLARILLLSGRDAEARSLLADIEQELAEDHPLRPAVEALLEG